MPSDGPDAEAPAVYARVSTGGQKLEPQLDPLRAYAHRRGGSVVEYVDRTSGAKARRTGLDALMAAPSRRREVEAVVVVKLDRLARSVVHLVDLSREFEALGVSLVVLDQGIDTTKYPRPPMRRRARNEVGGDPWSGHVPSWLRSRASAFWVRPPA